MRVEYASENPTVPTREQEATATDAPLPEDIVYDETRVVEILNRLFAEQRPMTLDPGQWTR